MAKQSRSLSILLTRPAAQSKRFSLMLQARLRDVEIVVSPLISPRFRIVSAPVQVFSGVIFTSEVAVQACVQNPVLLQQQRGKVAWCVGDRTAIAAQMAGFEARSAMGGVESLFSLIYSAKPQGVLLYLRGSETTGNLGSRLLSAGIETFEIILYDQLFQPLNDAAISVLRQKTPIIVPIFSPRTARFFAQSWEDHAASAPLYLAAMSENVACALASLPHRAIEIAERSDAVSMCDAVEKLCTVALEHWQQGA